MTLNKKDKIYISFLTSYLLLLLLVLSLGAISYFATLRIVEKDTNEANMALLDKSRQIIEGRFSEVERILNQLAMHPQITRISYSENPIDGGNSLIQIKDVRDLLAQYQMQDSFLASLHLFLSESNIIITSRDIYLRKDIFYSHFFKYKNLTAAEWENLLFSEIHSVNYHPLSNVKINCEQESVLVISQSLFIKGYGLTNSAVITAFIRADTVSSLLESSLLKGSGVSMILDKDGQLIAESRDLSFSLEPIITAVQQGDSETVIQDQRMILSSIYSEERGWTYITAVPRKIALSKIVVLRRYLFLFITISLMTGIIISIFLALRTSAPLREIRGILSHRKDLLSDENSLNRFPGAVQELLNRNSSFRERISRQTSLLYASFLENLIMGNFEDDHQVEQAFSILDRSAMQFPQALLCVKIINRCGNSDSPYSEALLSFRYILRTVSEELVGGKGICHDTGFDTMLVLWYCPETKYREAVEKLAEEITALMSSCDGCQLIFSSGHRADSFCDVARTYKEGITAQNYLYPVLKNNIRWFMDIPEKGIPYYPLELEKCIINSVIAGDLKGTEEFLIQLEENNFTVISISYDAQQQLKSDLRSTLLKIINRMELIENETIGLQKSMTVLFSSYTVATFFMNLRSLLSVLADQRNIGKHSHNDVLKNKLLEYINNNYCDSQFYLAEVADNFKMSEVYLSQFFKEQTGENFSTYLERHRINKAKTLMKIDEKTLSEISVLCGYNSSQVFRRAFKRIEGISPSQFRENS
ncbi:MULTISPECIES: AraC family transcriptional regulator [unclassified Oceanispirochaeta]|uniref:AraC family transcriptional regulator n=1 Tax=unclassified Oceanispirochaeta TaxID=2635722 RepID=UPI000E098C4E|nr:MULTISPECIES: helix-turn-helix domain-containing protein [unclassified Oceanispirochaeta]MBF9017617.1 AraC family transcriptional regulator [Oceanispirochaeta sp. M2]NPD74189.1 AraC family transcriptional regulator [Oceanispirochaeta sp. M1]RDG30001.1 AraC family transcriptional regulator [Oceanispirochaeta sp. M1]